MQGTASITITGTLIGIDSSGGHLEARVVTGMTDSPRVMLNIKRSGEPSQFITVDLQEFGAFIASALVAAKHSET